MNRYPQQRRPSSSTGLAAATAYARLGWSVIPIEPRGKRPLIAWKTYQSRRPQQAEITAWFARWPTANVAVVTGAISGLVVLDLDPRHGAAASIEQLQRTHGRFAATVTAVSGGGGWHLYFAYPGTPTSNRVGLLPGVDLRGDGGYIVAPPSIHPGGGTYAWRRSPDTLPLAPLPNWLRSPVRDPQRPRGRPLAHWRQIVRHGVGAGERNNTVASLAGHLLRRGVDVEVVAELLQSWNTARCRPPLADDEVGRTVASIARLHQRGESTGQIRPHSMP